MDTKRFSVKIKAAGKADGLEDGQFLGYASVFDNVDSYGDVVRKGAFADTLAEWDAKGDSIPLLWGHDMVDPWSNIGSVEASEDDHGLLVKGTFDMENPKAQQVYRLVKGRRVGDMSFAYDVLDSGPTEVDGSKVLELRKLRLYEASIVPIGANQETEILAVKANADALSEGIKAGRVLAAKHIDSLRAAQEAIGVVIAAATESSDTEKASGNADAKDQEPVAPVKSEEPRPNPSAHLIAELTLLSLR